MLCIRFKVIIIPFVSSDFDWLFQLILIHFRTGHENHLQLTENVVAYHVLHSFYQYNVMSAWFCNRTPVMRKISTQTT